MNIKIVDSWLREFLKTKATNKEIAKQLSLTSVSVERTEKVDDDLVYDIEVTTNRPDLMSVIAIAKEASVALKQDKIHADFEDLKITDTQKSSEKFPLDIKSDPKLTNRICAVVLDVQIGLSPKKIKDRLESSGIRSLNNLIDVTNYVMRETGHPTHVFDFDLLTTKKMIIRESRSGEKITTLDGKTHTLTGGDIVADDGLGKIIDLLGVMGTQNSVVNDKTKKILFFLDNNNPLNIRKTSMSLGIRTEAAIINEKGIDPELMMTALKRGIELYKEIANGKVISEIFDYYPNKPKTKTIKVPLEKINKIIGVEIDAKISSNILEDLGFKVKVLSNALEVEAPTLRPDVTIDEDVIEEVARIYGYHKLPSVVPTFLGARNNPYANNFFYEEKVKNSLKYFGFTETYTYSLVSEELFEGPLGDALKLKNPLSEDLAYLRNSLIPSLLKVVTDNKKYDEIKIFELANVYIKNSDNLPKENLTLSAVLSGKHANFFNLKGVIEQLLSDIGIKNLAFKKSVKGGLGASVYIDKDYAGEIEVLDSNLVDFELNFSVILKHAKLRKEYKPFAKFPPITEDLSVVTDESIKTEEIIETIKTQSNLVQEVTLKDSYQDTRTFHIVFQDFEKNLTKEDVTKIREKIISSLSSSLKATIK